MSNRLQYADVALSYCIFKAFQNLEIEEAIIVRNWLESLPCGCNPPYIVKLAIAKRLRHDLSLVEMKITGLRAYGTESGRYYGFEYQGMFFGVEPDGYIHT